MGLYFAGNTLPRRGIHRKKDMTSVEDPLDDDVDAIEMVGDDR